MIKQVTGVITLTTMLGSPMVASADWTDDWMMDVRFNYALTSDASGTDQDVGDNQHIATFNGDGIQGESSFGFAFGKRFDNLGVSLVYEPMSADYDATGSVLANGTVLTNATSEIDADTWMLEIDYMIDINETFAWNLLFGIGQTEFDAGTITLATAAGTATVAADAVTNSETSTRFGVGLTYKMSESAALITMLQFSDYGTVNQQISDGQTTVTTGDVEATQLSMRLRFMF